MRSLLVACRRFLVAEDGPTAVEYAIMLAFIIIVCIAAITTVGQGTSQAFVSANVGLS